MAGDQRWMRVHDLLPVTFLDDWSDSEKGFEPTNINKKKNFFFFFFKKNKNIIIFIYKKKNKFNI